MQNINKRQRQKKSMLLFQKGVNVLSYSGVCLTSLRTDKHGPSKIIQKLSRRATKITSS